MAGRLRAERRAAGAGSVTIGHRDRPGPVAASLPRVPLTIRTAEPSDHARVVAVVDEWWGGRSMAAMLPRLFFEHFRDTSFVVEDDSGELAGFLVGFLSQSHEREAYVHFVGVAPAARGSGLGRELYERFFAVARAHGRDMVKAVTSPVNTASVAFHRSIGFEAAEPAPGYDGPGEDRVRCTRHLTPT
jgi:ribosomal protein S18 acetylase RimI-like enzyme